MILYYIQFLDQALKPVLVIDNNQTHLYNIRKKGFHNDNTI